MTKKVSDGTEPIISGGYLDAKIQEYMEKSDEELQKIDREGALKQVDGTYDRLLVARTLELTGRFKKWGYETFENYVDKHLGISLTMYDRNLRVGQEYEADFVNAITWAKVLLIENFHLPKKAKEIVIEKLEQEIQKGNTPTRGQVKRIAQPLAPIKNRKKEENEIEILKTKYRQAKKVIEELRKENRDLKEKLLSTEVKLEDSKRYIEELQRGDRAM
jgi:hypothetical protein